MKIRKNLLLLVLLEAHPQRLNHHNLDPLHNLLHITTKQGTDEVMVGYRQQKSF
jgi:hypothetical protein